MSKLYEQAEGAGRPFDIVVANAGMAESAPASKTSLELWNRTIEVNLTGAFLTVKPALAAMRARGWGRIVFIASTAGLKGYAYVAPYVAAKHGVVGLMRALALETATAGITVNAVCPGFTETDDALGRGRSHRRRRPSAARRRRAPPSPRTIRKAGSSGRRRSPTPCCGCAPAPAQRSPARRFRCREARRGERSTDPGTPGLRKQGAAAPVDQAAARHAARRRRDARAVQDRVQCHPAALRRDGRALPQARRHADERDFALSPDLQRQRDRHRRPSRVGRIRRAVAARRRPPHVVRAPDRQRPRGLRRHVGGARRLDRSPARRHHGARGRATRRRN